jgi:hypothetical protein
MGGSGAELVANIAELTINARVMAPLGDVLHRGIIVELQADHPGGEGMICVAFTPPVKTITPFDSIDAVTCPASSVTLGWWLLDD